jgi:antitoxin component YwqK of YwqJK toxin-antitoxin module
MDGKLKAEGQYADAELNVPNGTFTFFHPNGKKESIGEYRMGR